MSKADRRKWNARYREAGAARAAPAPFLLSLKNVLPRRGRALDVAGGSGRHAMWLARRGLGVTLVDISPVALARAERESVRQGVSIQTMARDLEEEGLPPGPWDLIVCFYYLQRSLFAEFPMVLSPGGMLVLAQATRSNLARHRRPPEKYLLGDGELSGLVVGLEILHLEEGWFDNDRHEAHLLARRPAPDQE